MKQNVYKNYFQNDVKTNYQDFVNSPVADNLIEILLSLDICLSKVDQLNCYDDDYNKYLDISFNLFEQLKVHLLYINFLTKKTYEFSRDKNSFCLVNINNHNDYFVYCKKNLI